MVNASRVALAVLVLAGPLAAPRPAAARRGVCDVIASGGGGEGPRIAVLSAFPAELAPLVAAATITETVAAEGRVYYLGTLAGVRVVLARTGIGLLNADAAARDVLKRFRPRALVFSGVAGSPERIGDVVVATTWSLAGERRHYPANPALLALARTLEGGLALARCTEVPGTGTVCLPHEPAVFVEGEGLSEDPFGDNPFPCVPGGDDVFGCDVPGAPGPAGDAVYPTVVDMETAAVARRARQRRVPFVAFRATSDGAGDPLGLPGFPAQFFAYYPLAAANAATATTAWLEQVAALADAGRAGRRTCRLLARHRWRRAAKRIARAAE